MTIGISKESLEKELIGCSFPERVYELHRLIRMCKELNPWLPIENAPKDKDILVYAPSYQDLRHLQQVCRWHNSAGFCIDELRTPTHYKELPEDPKEI